jgi:hypothetical protein
MSASSIGMVDLMVGRTITSRHHYHQSSVNFVLAVRRHATREERDDRRRCPLKLGTTRQQTARLRVLFAFDLLLLGKLDPCLSHFK